MNMLSATELYLSKCTFQRCIDCIDISRRSQLWGVKQRWDGKTKSSYTHGCRALTWR